MKLGGWGNFPVVSTELCHAARPSAVVPIITRSQALVARGAGRAYGDAGIGVERTLDLTGLDRFIAFDEASGLLTTEAGVMLKDIILALLPRGFFPPVVPGTQFVTIGGMIASNVHGKNHHRDGGFGRHVVEIQLAQSDGSIISCSRFQNGALFQATIGGMGLTGVIIAATFKMQRVETRFIRFETLVAKDLDEVMEHCEASRGWHYTVAWIDSLATGGSSGRGLVFRGEHLSANDLERGQDPFEAKRIAHGRIPLFFPIGILNRYTVKAFNEMYYRKCASERANITDCWHYFFPLDALSDWNRLYGRQGLIQHQCVVPKSNSRDALGALLERIAQRGNPSFLAVLKLLGPDDDGLLSFPMEGYTLAIDFPADQKSLTLAKELDDVVSANGGRIYLAKDSRQSRATFEGGYANLAHFRELRRSTGASTKFCSYLAQRLGL